jgi:23S rRNA (guanosine2251-2'-O)-methyltransferase
MFLFMRKLTHGEIAQNRRKPSELETTKPLPVVVVVDNVRSLYNVGSIFRTSDGASIRKLILTGFTPRPPRREIEKTALGSTESVPWEYIKSPLEAIQRFRGQGYSICCLELAEGSTPYHSLPSGVFPLCLVIGNEITGISKDVLETADLAIEIPMFGVKQSLNVAVAYGIAVFEIGRLWRSSSAHSSNARV